MDAQQFAQIVMQHVSESLQPVVDALAKRIDDGLLALRAEFSAMVMALPPAKDGTPGAPGKDADMDALRAEIGEIVPKAVEAAIALLPPAKNGEPGMPGRDADMGSLRGEIADLVPKAVAEAVAALPKPKDGTSVSIEDVMGPIHAAVKDAVAAEATALRGDEQIASVVSPLLTCAKVELEQAARAHIAAVIAALPVPQDGTSVSIDDVLPELTKHLDSLVSALPAPKDGESPSAEAVAAALEPKVAAWALDFERRAQGVLERAIDRVPRPKDGADGRDGADGLGFEHLACEYDGDRRIVLRFVAGERIKEFPIDLPVVLDRGVFKEGGTYARNDGVTYGGSWWIARIDNPAGKPGVSDDWRLAVKRGRDGRDGRDGIDKTAPVKLT